MPPGGGAAGAGAPRRCHRRSGRGRRRHHRTGYRPEDRAPSPRRTGRDATALLRGADALVHLAHADGDGDGRRVPPGVIACAQTGAAGAGATPPPSCSTPPPPLASATWWRCRRPSSTAPGPKTRCPHRGSPLDRAPNAPTVDRARAELLLASWAADDGPGWSRCCAPHGAGARRVSSMARSLAAATGLRSSRRSRPVSSTTSTTRLGQSVRRVGLDGPCNVAPDGWIPATSYVTSGVWPRTQPCRCAARLSPASADFQRGPIPAVGAVHGLPVAGSQRPVEGVGLAGGYTNERAYVAAPKPGGGRCSAEAEAGTGVGGAGVSVVGLGVGIAVLVRALSAGPPNLGPSDGRPRRLHRARMRKIHHRPGVVILATAPAPASSRWAGRPSR